MVMQTDAVVSAAEYAAGLERMTDAMRAEPQRKGTELPPMLVRAPACTTLASLRVYVAKYTHNACARPHSLAIARSRLLQNAVRQVPSPLNEPLCLATHLPAMTKRLSEQVFLCRQLMWLHCSGCRKRVPSHLGYPETSQR